MNKENIIYAGILYHFPPDLMEGLKSTLKVYISSYLLGAWRQNTENVSRLHQNLPLFDLTVAG